MRNSLQSALERLDYIELCGINIFLWAKKAKAERNAILHFFCAGHVRVFGFYLEGLKQSISLFKFPKFNKDKYL